MKLLRTFGRAAGIAACSLAAISVANAQQPQRKDADRAADANNKTTKTPATNNARKVRLGVRIAKSPTTGVYVSDVAPGSAAQRSGIQRGDYILSMNGKKISSPQDFNQLMAGARSGGQAKLTIWRNQARRTLSVSFPQTVTSGFRGTIPGANDPQNIQQQPSQPWLGVQVAAAKDKQGARVVAVYPSGPASFAGLQRGDEITRIGDRDVKSPSDVTAAIQKMKPAQKVKIIVMRDGEKQTLTADLGNRSDYLAAGSPPQSGSRNTAGDFNGSMSGIPAHAMMLEQHRRFAQQHQRIEKLVLDLQKEIQDLRQEVRNLSGAKSPQPNKPLRKDTRRTEPRPQRKQ